MSAELVIVRAADETALVRELGRIVDFLDRAPSSRLIDVAFTAAALEGPSVLAVVAETVADLRARLASARSRLLTGKVQRIRDKSGTYYFREPLLGPGRGRLAFVYPGVLSFYPDMLRDLTIRHAQCRGAFDELEEALKGNEEFSPANFIFPPAPYYRHDADIFSSGAFAQALVANYAASIGLTRLLKASGIVPDGVIGFAGGDLAAMVRSGALGTEPPRPDRIRMIADIYKIVDKAVDHAGLPERAMITLLMRAEGDEQPVIAAFPPGKAVLAMDLSPRQKIYAIEGDYEATALAAFAAAGIRAMRLELRRPFNTPACAEKVVPAIRRFADAWLRQAPSCEVYSCASAAPVATSIRAAREDLAGRWARPVRFTETIRRMHADGYRVFLEVGPRGLMTAAVSDTLREVPHAAIALNSIHRRSTLQLSHALAYLAALGCVPDLRDEARARGARALDFDSQLPRSSRRESEMRLSRSFPRLTLLSADGALKEVSALAEPKGRGAKVAARAAAVAAQARRNRQFGFGALNPLVSDADVLAQSPGVAVEIRKTFKLADAPFIGDSAIGTTQLSYSDPNLRGLVLLTMPIAAEIMAETASMVAPNLHLHAIEDLTHRRAVVFRRGEATLLVKAERVASGNPEDTAVKVLLREDAPGGEYTWPSVEAVFVLRAAPPAPQALAMTPLSRPRTVHWSGRDIYPTRVSCGRRLRGIRFAEAWSEAGLDYEIEMPALAGAVTHTRFPLWTVNPLLLEVVVSGFQLWRSHERFAGAYSFPFRLRRLDFVAPPAEGAHLKCYLRLTGVTPKSHLSDIAVSDGNGSAVMTLSGWEELTERINPEYRSLVMTPASSFVTEALSSELMGSPATEVSSAFVTDVNYPLFERSEEIWLKVFSHIVLSAPERRSFFEMSGSAARRAEWLFGRIAVKEAVRRFLKDNYQARWSDADVVILADDKGKPYAVGEWKDFLPAKLDVAIAHTAKFIVALAAANARVGVDVESVARNLSEEFAAGVFTPEELELAANAANAAQAVIRFWCAKEAVSKALGTGIRYSPKELVITSYQVESGRLTVRLEGAWAEAFRSFKGRDIAVTVRNLHEHALAFCFLPLTLFDEE